MFSFSFSFPCVKKNETKEERNSRTITNWINDDDDCTTTTNEAHKCTSLHGQINYSKHCERNKIFVKK